MLTPAVTRDTVSQADELLAIARFGVGYDSVDVAACTEADVAVMISAGAVDHSVAEATVGWMIALGHHLRAKDQLVRSGAWHERSRYMGQELRQRVVGVVGLGGIAQSVIRLLSGFGMGQPLAYDPFADKAVAERLGVRLVELDVLLAAADYVSLHCPLTPTTRGLIGRRELALMKPSAYLLNTARGGIVDEDALFEALSTGKIAGAALDCFAEEPVTAPHRFGRLDNVLLAPHCIAWTHELFRDIGRTICQAVVELSLGRKPPGVVNPLVFERPSFRANGNDCAAASRVRTLCRRPKSFPRKLELTTEYLMATTRLAGQVAWISGAATGIGAATARLFAAEGARVALVGQRQSESEAVAAEIRAAGGEALAIGCDVSRESEVSRSIDETVKAFGSLQIVVNNAGVVQVKLLHECSEADWDHLMAVNVKSILFSTRHAWPHLRRNRRSYMVNVGSISSFVGQAMTPAYTASKHAVLGLSRSIALDYASEGLRCNCVCPGITDTPMLREHLDVLPDPEGALNKRLERVAMGVALQPEDVARSILYLSCEDSSGVTGTSLIIDCGYLAAAEWQRQGPTAFMETPCPSNSPAPTSHFHSSRTSRSST